MGVAASALTVSQVTPNKLELERIWNFYTASREEVRINAPPGKVDNNFLCLP